MIFCGRVSQIILTLRAFSRCFCTKLLTVIHTYTDGSGCNKKGADKQEEQSGVQYLAQADFDVQTRGIEPAAL